MMIIIKDIWPTIKSFEKGFSLFGVMLSARSTCCYLNSAGRCRVNLGMDLIANFVTCTWKYGNGSWASLLDMEGEVAYLKPQRTELYANKTSLLYSKTLMFPFFHSWNHSWILGYSLIQQLPKLLEDWLVLLFPMRDDILDHFTSFERSGKHTKRFTSRKSLSCFVRIRWGKKFL